MSYRLILASLLFATAWTDCVAQPGSVRIDSIMQHTAVLVAVIDSMATDGEIRFEWATGPNDISSSPSWEVKAGAMHTELRYTISGLLPNTEYFYRSVTEMAGGPTGMWDEPFTTAPEGTVGVTLLPISVADRGGVHTTRWFGVHPDATYCPDPVLHEYILPPPPPLTVLEARFVEASDYYSCLQEGMYRDFRFQSDPPNREVYKLRFQPGDAGYPITLSWPDAAEWSQGALVLQDAINGDIVHVDMKRQTSCIVANRNIHELLIISGDTPRLPQSPTIAAREPVNVGQNAVRLSALVDAHSTDATSWVEWGASVSYGSASTPQSLSPIDSYMDVLFDVHNLTPGAGYHYRTVAQNATGRSLGPDQTLITVRGSDSGSTVIPFTCIGGQDSTTVFFGFHPQATSCIDTALGEHEIPPSTDYRLVDLRFVNGGAQAACLGFGLHLDLRRYVSPDQADTFYLWLAPAFGYQTFILSWPNMDRLFRDSVILRDTRPGGFLNVDMKSMTRYSFFDPDLRSAMIIARGPLLGASLPQVVLRSTNFESDSGLSLMGTVLPNGQPTKVWGEWGPTTAYGNRTVHQDVGSGILPIDVSCRIESTLTKGSLFHYHLVAENSLGTAQSPDVTFIATSVPRPVTPVLLPDRFLLQRNYPNPFNPSTTIRYQLPSTVHVSLKIFNVFGQLVSILADEVQNAGFKTIEFSAVNLPSGVYLYVLTAGEYSDLKKMILAK